MLFGFASDNKNNFSIAKFVIIRGGSLCPPVKYVRR